MRWKQLSRRMGEAAVPINADGTGPAVADKTVGLHLSSWHRK